MISAGTEGSTVKTARKGYIGKAKERPQQVKQVIDTLKTQGIKQTYRDEKDVLENEDINTVFIATRHDSHAEFVLKALKAEKHVFVEKPLCLTEEELGQIVELLNSQMGKLDGTTNRQSNDLTI